MPVRGYAVHALRLEYEQNARTLREQRLRIQTDPQYTATERARALAPIDAELTAMFERYRPDIARQIEIAKAEHLKQRPRAQQLRAALANPSRAVAMRQLAEGQPAHVKQEIAQCTAQERDLAGAYGVSQTLTDSDESDLAVANMLATVGADVGTAAMADYVAALSEAALFEASGVYGDAVLQDPLRVLSEQYEIQSLPEFGGGTINLSLEDVDKFRELAGVV